MATYAIGDIQGCFDELQNLLEEIAFSSEDTLWFCGDLVNRGPKSLETLRFIKSLGQRAITVLGNHDLHLLALHYNQAPAKNNETLQAILDAPDRQELMNWLEKQPLLYTDPNLPFTLVHAGIPPAWSLKKAHKRAREVEAVLQSDKAVQFYAKMYGNKPEGWRKNIKGWDRLRVITNYFTRMRFCTPEGDLEFASKGGLETQPVGYLPWYQYKERRTANNAIIFGHWAALLGQINTPNTYAIDTGCVWGERLTALRLDDLALFSTPSLQPLTYEN